MIRSVIFQHTVYRLHQLDAERVPDRLRVHFGVVGVIEITADDHAPVVYRERLQVLDESGHGVVAPQIELDVRDVEGRDLLLDLLQECAYGFDGLRPGEVGGDRDDQV